MLILTHTLVLMVMLTLMLLLFYAHLHAFHTAAHFQYFTFMLTMKVTSS
jgi:hypothetical protein